MKACRGFVHLPILVIVAVVALMVPVSKYVVSNQGEVPKIFNIDGRAGLDRETQDKIDKSNLLEQRREDAKRITEEVKQAFEKNRKPLKEQEITLKEGKQADADRWKGLADLWQGNHDGAMNDSLSGEFITEREEYLNNVGGNAVAEQGQIPGVTTGNSSSGNNERDIPCRDKNGNAVSKDASGNPVVAFGPLRAGERYTTYKCDGPTGSWVCCPNCQVTYGPQELRDSYHDYADIVIEVDEVQGDEWGVYGDNYGSFLNGFNQNTSVTESVDDRLSLGGSFWIDDYCGCG